ncbi:hypothetical protein [Streptomyces sp. TRM70350]|uniref:hypothetical protein n=1 Tax=Streptomyces sp. TRM70350 TaxID=2856165 RepID=UPI00210F2A3D|nr:hypothetical protein [Streptomyces sp. TRM70350]
MPTRPHALASPRPDQPDRFARALIRQTIDVNHIILLYRAYADDLDRAREKQRRLLASPTSLKAQLDDIEAEITYLLLRETRPETVVEIGTFHGWCPGPGSGRNRDTRVRGR